MKRNPTSGRLLDKTILVLGVIIALYHLLNAFVLFQGVTSFYMTHLGSLMIFGFLFKLRGASKRLSWLILLCLALTVVTISYLFINAPRLEGIIEFITDTDLVMGILFLIPLFILFQMFWGWILVAMAVIGLLYFSHGHLIPGPLQHVEFSLKYVISSSVTGLTRGVFAELTSISANCIFYFMMLSGVMQLMGAVPGFLEFGKLIAKLLRGGPAWTSVVGSSLVAMITGSGSANVALSGTATIPAMVNYGFKPHVAASIEAAAAVGGQVTPPVMGAGAFIMAAFLGVSYTTVMAKSIVGAILYYLTLSIGVLIYCHSKQMPRYRGSIDTGALVRRLPIFAIPLLVLTILILRYYSLQVCASIAVLLTIALGLILVPETRSLKRVAQALGEGTYNAAQISIMMGGTGPMVVGFIAPGLAQKLTKMMNMLTGGLLIPSLLLLAVVAIILGMGLPVSAVYLLIAILILPSLWALGVDRWASHFFAFYFSVWGAVSPPEAPACAVASRLAGAKFWPTSWWAMAWLVCLFIYPFVIVLHPSLLNFPNLGWTDVMWLAIILVTTVLTAVAMFNWFLLPLRWYERLLVILADVTLTAYIFAPASYFIIVGGACLSVLLLSILRRRSKAELTPEIIKEEAEKPLI